MASASWNYQSHGLDWTDATCTTGTRQSPINIVKNEATVVPKEDLLPLWKSCGIVDGQFMIEDNTLKFKLTDGKAYMDDYLSGGPLDVVKYFFLEFVLHWGSTDCDGSEHTVDFNRFPAELQLVHVKEDYVSVDGTVNQSAFTEEDGLAILSIFLQGGADPATADLTWFDDISNAAKDIAESSDPSAEIVPAQVNLIQIGQRINPSYSGEFNYWFYDGSLTTPVCEEVVRWIVAESPLHVSDDQVSFTNQLILHTNLMINLFIACGIVQINRCQQ